MVGCLRNSNMLSQMAADYSYRINSSNVVVGLLSASVNTWKNSWTNYRVYNTSTQLYAPGSEGLTIWRKSANYSWIGEFGRLRAADGLLTFNPTDKFNFDPVNTNPFWKKWSETTAYDHFSMPLEDVDHNNLGSAVKVGYDDRHVIAEASNAKFNEIAFSGAEDLQSNNYFGGEIKKGTTASISTTIKHSGNSSISLSTGYGFIFVTSGLEAQKKYRASVWSNSTNGRIYYKINPAAGGAEVLSPAPQKVVNGWYLIEIEIPVQVGAFSLEIGVKSALGTVYFDDFRFQPSQASMNCYVYDVNSKLLSHVLGNDNLFTSFEYDDRGFIIRQNVETFKYGIKKVTEYNKDYRRLYIDQ